MLLRFMMMTLLSEPPHVELEVCYHGLVKVVHVVRHRGIVEDADRRSVVEHVQITLNPRDCFELAKLVATLRVVAILTTCV